MTDENEKNLIKNLPYFIGVIISFLIALYIRTGSSASVFLSNGFVRFGGNDPWYHMRVVDTILHNFPHTLWFEAYTQYPNGQEMVFAPLYDWVLAVIIYILTLGNPTTHEMEVIGAYFPAFLGALVVIPTYFIGKWVFNRNVGLLSSILVAILPGAFLYRSLVGFTDHHVAETLMSTITAMFLVMSLRTMRTHPVNFDDLVSNNFNKLRISLPYIALTGISLGLYILAWKGALFFALIIGVYITIQHIIDHLRGEVPEYLSIIGVITFIIALLFVLMVPEIGSTKNQYLMGLPAGILAFIAFSLISRVMNSHKLPRTYYAAVPLITAALVYIVSRAFIPSLYYTIGQLLTYFMRSGGGLTIAEAYPFFVSRITGQFSLAPLGDNFGIVGYIAFLAIPVLLYQTYKEHKQEEIWIVVWMLMMVWALYQQNRFAYYFAVNASILSAYLSLKLLGAMGWDDVYQKYLQSDESAHDFVTENIKLWNIISVIIVIAILIYPIGPLQETLENNKAVGGPAPAWIESLTWMRYNTPDPGVDYYELYKKPPSGETYSYPDTAYGIMSWWDYGHWITNLGRRIPNANPFQRGIGGGEEQAPGASTYFTAQSEDEANAIADVMGSRYIISNGRMAYTIFGAMATWDGDQEGYYQQLQTNQGVQNVPTMKYFNSMEIRLHMLDGDGLKHYRMVHESEPYNPSNEPYVQYENLYKQVYNMWTGKNIPVETPSGFIKMFEYVEGAHIKGSAPTGETVTISTTIQTNMARTFTYSQITTSDGTYEFIVPYSTEGPVSGETQFDTKPIGPYIISYGNVVNAIGVSETEVLNGGVIEV
ncbi:MAG: oligosaccharyl transferase, archaeosortase A system-associated [Methanosarcinaceae archaeon]|nr:oligosaccharyl transferase, archaeosortase A system-associated [Methanosarcinaceae archaeon]